MTFHSLVVEGRRFRYFVSRSCENVDGGEKAERPAVSGGRWDFGAPR